MASDSDLRTPVTAAAEKLLGLELLRFGAAVAILVFHYRHFWYVGGTAKDFNFGSQPLYPVLWPLYQYGHYGVEIFWCVSGYIFFWKYRDLIRTGRIGGWRFFVLRFSRLYPLHLLTLLGVAALQAAYRRTQGSFFVYSANDIGHFVLQLLFASNWSPSQPASFNGPIWSISIEVLVYFIFYACLRITGASAWPSIALVAVSCLATATGHAEGLVVCIAFFFAGGLAATLAGHADEKGIDGPVAAGMAVALGLGLWMAYWLRTPAYKPFPVWTLLIAVAPLVFLAARRFPVTRPMRRGIEVAGNLTYASYLLHFPVQLAVVLTYASIGAAVPMHRVAFFLAYIAGMLALSYVVYRFFEAPAQDFIRARRRVAALPRPKVQADDPPGPVSGSPGRR